MNLLSLKNQKIINMLLKNLTWILNNGKLEEIKFTLDNIPLHIFVIEEIKSERKTISAIRQAKSHIILDEIYSVDKIGIAFYRDKMYRYLIRCISRNDDIRYKDIIIILNDNFDKYYRLKRIDYEKQWISLLYKVSNLSIQDTLLTKLNNNRKLVNNIKRQYMILTDCAKLSGVTDNVAITGNITEEDQPVLLYDRKTSLIVNANLIRYMFSLKLEVEYLSQIQNKFEEIRAVPQKTIKINITLDDIYSFLLLENLINSV